MKSEFGNRYLKPGRHQQFLPKRKFLFDRRELLSRNERVKRRLNVLALRQIALVVALLRRTDRVRDTTIAMQKLRESLSSIDYPVEGIVFEI